MAKLGCVRLWPLCPVSELGCAGLYVSVALMATHIYWAVLLHSLLCHLFSWDGFQDVSGLCSLHSGGDEVWGT